MSEPCGHIDFYPNNGKEQPGCDLTETPLPLTLIKEGIEEASRVLVACNHVRAIKLFIESINSKCPYVAHKCNSYQNFLQVIKKKIIFLIYSCTNIHFGMKMLRYLIFTKTYYLIVIIKLYIHTK